MTRDVNALIGGKSKVLIVVALAIAVLTISSIFVGSYLMSSGGYNTNGQYERGIAEATPVPTVISKDQTAMQETADKKVIYNAYLSMEVHEVKPALEKIRSYAEGIGGSMANMQTWTEKDRNYGSVTVRVPKDSFYDAIGAIEGYGSVKDKRVSSDDITEQYIDLEARLKTYKDTEERLLQILDMAKTVDEVLKVESELSRVRADVESLTGQINYLARMVEMSTITVSLFEPGEPSASPYPVLDWWSIVQMAVLGIYVVIGAIAVGAVSVVPLIALGALTYYLYKRRRAKK